MSVHYKFKAALGYDTLPIDGINISLLDLKEAIIQHKHLGKGKKHLAYDLQITNAETKEIYKDEKILIPKNSSLIVARIPVYPSELKNSRDNNRESTALLLSNPANLMNTEASAEAARVHSQIKENVDLTKMAGTEEDKIMTMIAQSTIAFHPSNFVKLRKSNMTGKVPKEYKCYKCHQHGHWVQNCTLNNQDLRKTTGIPSTFLKEVKDANVPGAMITADGKFVISHGEDGLMLIKQNEKTGVESSSSCSSLIKSKVRETKKTQMDQAPLGTVSPSEEYDKTSAHCPSIIAQSMSHVDQAPPGIAEFNIHVPPPGGYHTITSIYPPVPAQSTSVPAHNISHDDQAPPAIAEFNKHLPPPGYHKTSTHYPAGPDQVTSHVERYMSHQPEVLLPGISYHHTSHYIDQNNIVEDPLSAFNKLMEEKDMAREKNRKMRTNRPGRSHSRSIYTDYQSHSRFRSHNRYSSGRSSSSYSTNGNSYSSTSYRGGHDLPPPSYGRHRSRSRSPLSHRRNAHDN